MRLAAPRPETALRTALSGLARFDEILDNSQPENGLRRIQFLLSRVEVGGTVSLPADDEDERLRAALAEVQHLQRSQAVTPPRPQGDKRSPAERFIHSLASDVSFERQADRLVLRLHRELLTRVPEAAIVEIVRSRPDIGSAITVVDRAEAAAKTALVSNAPDEASYAGTTAPSLSVRTHWDVVCFERQAAHTDDLVLPDSYRHPHDRQPASPVLTNHSPTTVLRPTTEAIGRLEGSWFHLDSFSNGHFGHAFTEQLGRLWGWGDAVARHPDLRALMIGDRDVTTWERELFSAAGVPSDRIVSVPGPVRVEQLVCASPAYAIARYSHPVLRDVLTRVRRVCEGRSSVPRRDRVFFTRSDDRRRCTNRSEVEAHFAAAGFTVVDPAELPFSDQVALCTGAEVFAGFAGSNMFHLAAADSHLRVVVLASDTYHAENEKLMAAASGASLWMVRGTSKVRHPGHFSGRAMHSTWSVDLADVEHAVAAAMADSDHASSPE